MPPTLVAGRRSSSDNCWRPLGVRCRVSPAPASARQLLYPLKFRELTSLSLFSRLSAEGSTAEITAVAFSADPVASAAASDGSTPPPSQLSVVTVSATLPRGGSIGAEEAQYLTAVLQNDAKQVRVCVRVCVSAPPRR